jgi:hypothetical protein
LIGGEQVGRRISIALFFTIAVLGFGEVAVCAPQSFYGLVLSDDFTTVKIGSSKFSVAGEYEFRDILKALDDAHVEYKVGKGEYRLWANLDAAPAKVISADGIEITWLKNPQLIAEISVTKRGFSTTNGLSVGMALSDVLDLFGKKGTGSTDTLTFATKEIYTFRGHSSETGFSHLFVIDLRSNEVSLFSVQFLEWRP